MSSSVPIPPRAGTSAFASSSSSSSSSYRNSDLLLLDTDPSPSARHPWSSPSSAGSSSSLSSSSDSHRGGMVGKGKAAVRGPSYSSSVGSPSSPLAISASAAVGDGVSAASLSERERYSEFFTPRRPSLMGSSLSKSEHTVIHLGSADGAPRLVTCVKSSQGFDWNQELFLPSYADRGRHETEHRQEPVRDIVLTEEEAAGLLPS